jgi:hypothetical protein
MHRMKMLLLLGFTLLIGGCAGAYVGVGVHTPGPWGGPYPHPHGGGTVIIGRPMPSTYLPYNTSGQKPLALQPVHTVR